MDVAERFDQLRQQRLDTNLFWRNLHQRNTLRRFFLLLFLWHHSAFKENRPLSLSIRPALFSLKIRLGMLLRLVPMAIASCVVFMPGCRSSASMILAHCGPSRIFHDSQIAALRGSPLAGAPLLSTPAASSSPNTCCNAL